MQLTSSSSEDEDETREISRNNEGDADCDDVEKRGKYSINGLSPELSSSKKSLKSVHKEHKTPWSKVKGIIHHTRGGGTKKRNDEDGKVDLKARTDGSMSPVSEESTDIENCSRAPALTITRASAEELSSDNTLRMPNNSHTGIYDGWKCSNWFKVKFLPVKANSAPSSPVRSHTFLYQVGQDQVGSEDFLNETGKSIYDEKEFPEGKHVPQEERNVQEEIKKNYEELQAKLSQEFKGKLKEWEKSREEGRAEDGAEVTPDFKKKLQEWDKMKSPEKVNERTTSGTEVEEWVDQKKMEWQCIRVSPVELERTMKSREQRRLFIAERWRKNRLQDKGKNTKQLAWLEKELQKVDREKQRIEREREKFIQREARLKKMRLAIGLRDEVLIPTSSGLIRFEGISQKFTRKLYEWEMAQGIRPDQSTFALLEPGYRPRLNNAPHSSTDGGVTLIRSKSVGSVAELSNPSGGITHQPSSLSLNDMDELEDGCLRVEAEVPEAIIVDLDDVGEDAGLVANSNVIKQTPVYCYTPEEVTRLIDSSSSDSDKEIKRNIACKEVVQSSYQLLQENMSLLNKVKQERDVCLKLEHEMENLEGQINNVSRSFHEQIFGGHDESKTENELSCYEREATNNCDYSEEFNEYGTLSIVQHPCNPSDDKNQFSRINDVQNGFKKVPENHKNNATKLCLSIISQLLDMTEELESTLNERTQEVWRLRRALADSRRNQQSENNVPFQAYQNSIERGWRYSYRDEEVTELPRMVTNTILELKKALAEVCSYQEEQNAMQPQEELWNPELLFEERFREDSPSREEEERDKECSSPASSFTFHQSDQDSPKNWRRWRGKIYEVEEEEEVEGDEGETSSSSGTEEEVPPVRSWLYRADYTNERGNHPYSEMINEESSEEEGEEEVYDYQGDYDVAEVEENWKDDGRAVDVFVPTTRKMFSAVCGEGGTTSVVEIVVSEEAPEKTEREEVEDKEDLKKVVGRPPLVTRERAQSASPAVLRRKWSIPKEEPSRRNLSYNKLSPMNNCDERRDILLPSLLPAVHRPSIKSMIERYNKKINGEDDGFGEGSGKSSPIVWKSPLTERRAAALASTASIEFTDSAKNSQVSLETKRVESRLSCVQVTPQVPNLMAVPPPDKEITPCSTPESLRLRALRIKKAREEFFSIGSQGSSTSTEDKEDDGMVVEVGADSEMTEAAKFLVVKSASEGRVDEGSSGLGSRSGGVFGGFLKRLRPGSLRVSDTPPDGSPTHSCPSSPVLPPRHSKSVDSSSWIRNPAKMLFRPKGKYRINNN